MKVLIVSANSLPASPSGPAYVAGAVRKAGHKVEFFENLFATDLASELTHELTIFQPDVVGVSIRLVFGDSQDASAPWGTRHTDLRPRVKQIVDVIRQNSPAKIVLGGPGFNYYAHNWLDYLDLDYGIRGEGEEAFPLFLRLLADGGDLLSVPGLVFRKNGDRQAIPPHPVETLDDQALPAYDQFDLEAYTAYQITPAIFTKRGCAFACTYCPYSKLDGKIYRLKSPTRVLAEIQHIVEHTTDRKVMICDNNFNAPIHHAEDLCRSWIESKLDFSWGTGDLRPAGITDDFCRLLEDSRCFSVNLSIESASEVMLRRMKRGYTVVHVRKSLEALSRSKIPFGASLMLGAPGETRDTIAETLRVMDDYFIPNGVWVTLGIYLWTDYQEVVGEVRRAGLSLDDKELFSGAVYLSPNLSKSYLQELSSAIHARQGYTLQVNYPEKLIPA